MSLRPRGPRPGARWLPPLVAAGLALAACSAPPRMYSTWASLGEAQASVRHRVEPEALPPAGAFPWAGTVSHHLLAGDLIDRWFAEIASRRDVEVFYILSPSHWGLSTRTYSITDGAWKVAGGLVRSDAARARALAETLGVSLEPTVFDQEHGVSTLMPYIAKHFPRARVVAVAYRGEPPVNEPMAAALAGALAPAFDAEGRRRNFLVISSDFSHHGDAAKTSATDSRSRRYFEGPLPGDWILVGCDNRPGLYALARLAGEGARDAILFHSDSLSLSGQGASDVTSYFFTLFY